MSTLKVVLFSYDPEISILSSLPSIDELKAVAKSHPTLNLSFLIVDREATSLKVEQVEFVGKIVYTWLEKAALDRLEEDLICLALAEAELDTYSIMERLETQRYEQRQYHYLSTEAKALSFIKKVVRDWVKVQPLPVNEEEEAKASSPRRMQPSSSAKAYRLYSGEALPETLSELDREAVYWRMLLLCRTIKAYLRMGFQRKYDLAEMRKLPSVETGYVTPSYYTKAQIQFMVRYSYFFQVEDPLLKGFLLAHPVKVVANPPSEFSDFTRPAAISPLDIGRDLQWLILNHGQFRHELLVSLMRVLAAFAANNGILTAENVPETNKPVLSKPKLASRKKSAPLVTGRKGISITSGILRSVEPEPEDQEIAKREVVPKMYYEKEIWNIISVGIEDTLGLAKE